MKLAGTIHRVINGRVVGNGCKGRFHLGRPGDPAYMAIIEDPDSRTVFLVFVVPSARAPNSVACASGGSCAQLIRFLKPELNGGRRVRDNQRDCNPGGWSTACSAADVSHPTLAQQVIAVLNAQMPEQIVKFVQEKANPPEVGAFARRWVERPMPS